MKLSLGLALLAFSVAARAAIIDAVDFNAGALSDNFNDNVLFGGSPYSLATNGVSGSQGIDLSNSVNGAGSPTSEGTLVFKNKGYDLSTLTSLEVSCLIRKQTIATGSGALYLGLTGTSAGALSGVAGDTFVGMRLAVVSGGWRMQWQSKAAASASVANATSSAFTTVDGNWYRFKVTFTRKDAATLTVTAAISDASASGTVGAQIATFGGDYTTAGVSEIAGDHQVWAALRGVGAGGADALDNFQVMANGVNPGVPAAPALTVTDLDATRASLVWADNSVNEESFVVSRSATLSGPYTDLATLAANTTAWIDTTADRLLAWYYQVRAVSGAGSAVSSVVALAAHRPPYRWQNVAMGGGGYVTGIFLHPTEPNLIYLRSDVGGFFRWDPANGRWIPLLDFITLPDKDLYGGESLALDRSDPNVVYIACGRTAGTTSGYGAIFKSTDRGANWTKLPLTGVKMGANESKRSSGERLVVSPHHPGVILFGSRNDGLWRSADAGASWAKATGFPGPGTPLYGITSVVFDPQTPGLVYAALYDDGVYRSADDGITWAKLTGGPAQVNRMAVSSTGALYATHQAGVGKYAGGAWTLTSISGTPLYGLSINPANPSDLLVAEGEADTTRIYRSLNAGASWTLQSRTTQSMVPWSQAYKFQMPHVAAIEFDPFTTGRVWTTDFYGVWHTENISAATPLFTDEQRGLENVVSLSLLGPASGPSLLAGVADVDGFRYAAGLSDFPAQRMGIAGTRVEDTTCMAAYEGDPLRMVRCVANKTTAFHVATSTDGGANWSFTSWNTKFPTLLAQRVAISATDPANFVIATAGDVPRMTADEGGTWQTVTGLPNGPGGSVFQWTQGLAADRVLAGTFYYYDTLGKVYRSTDKGLTFARVNTAAVLPSYVWSTLRTLPGAGGDLWLSLDTSGLYHSTDSGATFAKLATVDRAWLFCFGKAAPASTTPALYLYGRVNGSADGVFRSLDLGQTWTDLTDLRVAGGDSPCVMEASAQQYGAVYLGTNGRGVFAGLPLETVTVTSPASPAQELGPVARSFTVTRTGDLLFPLEVGFTLSGTATNGLDFAAIAGPVTIPAGAASASVTVTPMADSLAEGDESVTLTLNPGGTWLAGVPGVATISIADLPYDAWRFAHGLPSTTADPDSDGNGISDFLEYARGEVGSSTTLQNGQLTLTYQRLRDPAEVSWTVEVSSDLVRWDSGSAYVQETLQPDGITVVARDLAPAGSPSRFIRLRVRRLP